MRKNKAEFRALSVATSSFAHWSYISFSFGEENHLAPGRVHVCSGLKCSGSTSFSAPHLTLEWDLKIWSPPASPTSHLPAFPAETSGHCILAFLAIFRNRRQHLATFTSNLSLVHWVHTSSTSSRGCPARESPWSGCQVCDHQGGLPASGGAGN